MSRDVSEEEIQSTEEFKKAFQELASDGLLGVSLIEEERARQIEKEGWSAEHDDGHTKGELAMAACCYAQPERLYKMSSTKDGVYFHDAWPFEPVNLSRSCFNWDKRRQFIGGNHPMWPDQLSDEQRLDLLVKAGALIAAEIDRLKRLKPSAD